MSPLIFATLLSATISTAHAGGGPPVTIVPVAVENMKMGLSGGSLDVVLEAERTRGIRVRLRHLDYEVLMAGDVLSKADRDYSGTVLKKGQPVDIAVPVNISAGDALNIGVNALTKGNMGVRVRGEIGLSIFFIPFTVPFDQKLNPNQKRGGKKKNRR